MAGTIYTECKSCGAEFDQPDDPGKRREYCSNACRQRAYRRRGGRASGTRYESARSQQRRAEQEAWAEQEAQRERARERMRQARGRRAERIETPEWTHAQYGYFTDSPAQKKAREKCRLLYTRAGHNSTPGPEADACRAMADRIRAKHGL